MKIRTKVIISLINQGQVLLSEGYDRVRDIQFYIPVGGGVEFGERLEKAAKRELFEELGVKDQELKFANFHESLFEFQGIPEHEIMFHYVCHIDNSVRASLPAEGVESNGECFKIGWFTREALSAIQKKIVPPSVYNDIINELC
ncbi:MAG: NUDIX domain-containing protein [Planctomycetes bacterium]|nr:NUDIX domain-containing protein [Planctomycetota bacterium]MCH9725750.1 NUDIX domain-containing protein [Planctomycetota bacterium]MCH9777805.1 NUDIX domain-containing protein [Planctomycetota bacterium]